MYWQRGSSTDLSNNITMFSLPFSCHILYTARHHFHSSFTTATRLWGRVPCYWPHVALPCPAAHAKLCFFLQIWWSSILLSIRQHSTHSPDVGRNTWIIFFPVLLRSWLTSVVLCDLKILHCSLSFQDHTQCRLGWCQAHELNEKWHLPKTWIISTNRANIGSLQIKACVWII